MTFIIEEDESLKARLTGLKVSDDRRTQRPVEVWFGQPDLELRARTYPYISIDLVDISEDTRRVQVGRPVLNYVPDGVTIPQGSGMLPLPQWPYKYNLDYAISVWTRHPRHDRTLVAEILANRLPIRGGWLGLIHTGRAVWLDMLGGPQVADTTDEGGKRLLRKVFNVRVATELVPTDALELIGARVTNVRFQAAQKSDFEVITGHFP